MSVPGQAAPRSFIAYRVLRVIVPVVMLGLFVTDELDVLHSTRPLPGPGFIAFFIGVAVASLVGTVALHEVGHLVVALVMLLPVRHVRLLPGRRGSGKRARVLVKPDADAAVLPIRMAVMALAGPVGNLAVAAFFWRLADRSGISAERHGVLLLPVIVGVPVGLSNLLPFHAPGNRSDGMQVLAWLTQPARNRKELAVKKGKGEAGRLAEYRAEFERGGIPDLAGLRSLVDYADAEVAVPAGMLLFSALSRVGNDAFVADLPRLIKVARHPRLGAPAAARLGALLAWYQATQLLNALLEARKAAASEQLTEVVDLAEYAFSRDDSQLPARSSLALARILQNRPKDARDLLIAVEMDREPVRERTNLYSIRAMAEALLGDLAQSRRLIASAKRLDGLMPLLPLAELMLKAVERRMEAADSEATAEAEAAEAAASSAAEVAEP